MTEVNIDFLGIGVQKAGTSWLHKVLQIHPEIWMPPRKELHYFDRSLEYPSPSFLASDKFSTRVNSQAPHNLDFKKKIEKELTLALNNGKEKEIKWYLKYFLETYNDTWYNSLFEEGKDKVCGEITPAYSFLTLKDIQHIYALYPKLKLILILRNPIDRAWSHLRFHIKLKKFSNDGSIKEMKEFIDSRKQVLRSDYLSIIDNWSAVFPREQIHFCFYDEIKENPQNFMNNIFNFLEIKPLKLQENILNQKINVSSSKEIPKEIEIYLIEKYLHDIQKFSKTVGSYSKKWLSQTLEAKSLHSL